MELPVTCGFFFCRIDSQEDMKYKNRSLLHKLKIYTVFHYLVSTVLLKFPYSSFTHAATCARKRRRVCARE